MGFKKLLINYAFFSVFLFIALLIPSIVYYPGSSPFDIASKHYSFTHNFLSDLGREKTYYGENNTVSSVFFAGCMIIISSGLCALALGSGLVLRENKGKFFYAFSVICGCISSVFLSVSGFFPWDTRFLYHIWSVNFGLMFLIIFLLLLAASQYLNKISLKLYLANLLTAFCIIVQALILVIGPSYLTREGLPLQVIVQKIVTAVILMNLLIQAGVKTDKTKRAFN